MSFLLNSRLEEVAPVVDRWRALAYVGFLTSLLGITAPYGGFIVLPVSFILKNKLHLNASDTASFFFWASMPFYFGFLFGWIRDRLATYRLADRGLFLAFGLVSASLYAALTVVKINYGTLLSGVLLLSGAYLVLQSAQNGLMSTFGQQNRMTGRISTVYLLSDSIPGIVSILAGGALSEYFETTDTTQATRILSVCGTIAMVGVSTLGIFRSSSVFGRLRPERMTRSDVLDDIKMLLRHRPVYPALIIFFLWNFEPGIGTPLQYFLQNQLHATDQQWGIWNAIFGASFIPSFLVFGYLCRRMSLKPLLLWGTIVAIPQLAPLLLIHSITAAMLAALCMGLLGGVANASYLDLVIRSCPTGLHGTMLMMSVSLASVSGQLGNLVGTNLYERFGGLGTCVGVSILIYLLIFPAIAAVPKGLISWSDGSDKHDDPRLSPTSSCR
jgi:hypothetical protein